MSASSEAVSTPTPGRSIWRELGDAIRGTEADYTKIPLRRAIFLLAVPMILELVMEATFAVVDIYFVGKLGASLDKDMARSKRITEAPKDLPQVALGPALRDPVAEKLLGLLP